MSKSKKPSLQIINTLLNTDVYPIKNLDMSQVITYDLTKYKPVRRRRVNAEIWVERIKEHLNEIK